MATIPREKYSRSASGSTPTGMLQKGRSANSGGAIKVTRVHLSGLEGSVQYKTSWQNALIDYPTEGEFVITVPVLCADGRMKFISMMR
jgi:hypothetical protein